MQGGRAASDDGGDGGDGGDDAWGQEDRVHPGGKGGDNFMREILNKLTIFPTVICWETSLLRINH